MQHSIGAALIALCTLLTSCAQLTPAPSATLTPSPQPTSSAASSPTPIPAFTATPTSQPTSSSTPTHTPSATATRSASPTTTARPTATTVRPSPRVGQSQMRGGAPMVEVPAGDFLMGSRADPFAFAHETPQHKVYLDAFWIDQFEVTNALYAQCVVARACRPPSQSRSSTRTNYYGASEFADYPVIYVSWSDAKTFCAWSGKRLPTEAEWEKGARGPDGSIYPWGVRFEAERVNAIPHGPGDTTRVGSYPSGVSVYGAYEMAGNVWEWSLDFYQSDYYRSSPSINPSGPLTRPPPSEAIGVLRGGAWNNNQRAVRSANRLNYFQRHVGFEAGIRCAWGGEAS